MSNISLRNIGLGVIAMATACFAFAAVPAEAPGKGAGQAASYYYVAGGVKRPGEFELSAKKVTLKQAVAAAGIDRDADQRVLLIHLVGGGDQQAFTLKEVLASEASPALRGGDVIEVSSGR